MKLSALFETSSNIGSKDFKSVDIWDGEDWGSANVRVTYEYEPSDYTDHPYGETSAREHHAASVSLSSVVLLEPLEKYADGDPTGEVINIGVDLMQHEMWRTEYSEYFEGKLLDELEDGDSDPEDSRDWDGDRY